MNEVEYIKDRLEETERLLGLTEEALELALAALKLRRVLDMQPSFIAKSAKLTLRSLPRLYP